MSSRSSVVWQGTLVTSAISAFGTGLHGIVTGKPNYGSLPFAAAINGGISAATFFSIREYAVSPAMVSLLPRGQFECGRNEGQALHQLTWSEIRLDRLPDSCASGFMTGGILRGLTRGPRAAFPGALTAGAMCMLLQYMFNELKIVRLEYVSHQLKTNETSAPSILPPPSTNTSTVHTTAPVSSPNRSWTTRMLESIGIKSLSDEDYLIKLKQQREAHLRRISELEKQIEREKNGEDG